MRRISGLRGQEGERRMALVGDGSVVQDFESGGAVSPRALRFGRLLMNSLAVACGLFWLGACQSVLSSESAGEVEGLHESIETLYQAFCFDAGEEPDWETQRSIFLEGASFVAPIREGQSPTAVDVEQFLSDFRSFVRSEPYCSTGFHERLVGLRIEHFGGVAHAFVAFEGFVPGTQAARSRGLDSIQFVRAEDSWRLVSFTTQYESEDQRLPTRFLTWRVSR